MGKFKTIWVGYNLCTCSNLPEIAIQNIYATVKTKGKALKHIAPIGKEYLDRDIQVILIFGQEQKYDIANDPDWIMVDKEDDKAFDSMKIMAGIERIPKINCDLVEDICSIPFKNSFIESMSKSI